MIGNGRAFSMDIMDGELQKYERYASGIKATLLLAGLWPGRGYSRIYRLVAIVNVILCTFVSSGVLCFIFDHIKNVHLVTKGLGLAVSYYTSILKVIVFSINHHRLVELHENLEIGFTKDLTNLELRPILLSPLKFFYHPTQSLWILTWMLMMIYDLTPLISITIQRLNDVEPIELRTPYPTKYPWSYFGNISLYVIQYIIEICSGLSIGAITVATDALFGFYIFQMTSQFRTISFRIENLTITDDYHEIIKECVTRRQMLANCRDKLQTLYGPIVLWLIMTSAVTICANVFQASQMSFDKAMLVLVYIITKLLQTMFYGWYGLFLTTESEAFRQSVYYSGWPDSTDKSLLSNVRIMLMYKPFVVKACHISVISLDMVMAIMNTAMSYFFLLQTLDDK